MDHTLTYEIGGVDRSVKVVVSKAEIEACDYTAILEHIDRKHALLAAQNSPLAFTFEGAERHRCDLVEDPEIKKYIRGLFEVVPDLSYFVTRATNNFVIACLLDPDEVIYHPFYVEVRATLTGRNRLVIAKMNAYHLARCGAAFGDDLEFVEDYVKVDLNAGLLPHWENIIVEVE